MKHSDRPQVLILGERHIDFEPFAQRGLTPIHIKIEELNDAMFTNNARGILLAPPSGKYGLIYSYFEERFHDVCKAGMLTAIYATEKIVQVSEIRNQTFEDLGVGADIFDLKERKKWVESLPWVFIGEKDWVLAETLARHNPGPPLGSPIIDQTGVVERIDSDSEYLLKRAFFDAERITIKRLAGGKTAKEAFCVFANLSRTEYGPQPMPFFVKIDSSSKIEKETWHYRKVAEPFIPFHLRPSLNNARSVSSLKTSALVCNFVENAVSLREALRTGQGYGTIFSLFETTLRGLRSHTSTVDKKAGVLESFLEAKVRAHEIEEKQPERIRFLREFNKTRPPQEIEQLLKRHASTIITREGPYHGDLHYGNIMVRNRDAIVIDYGSMGPFGPLYADPAVLEVSLVFGTDDQDDPNGFESWREFVDYTFTDPLSPPLPDSRFPQFAWLHKAIRELRHVVACCGVEKNEALIILAGCLMRYGRNTHLKLATRELDSLAEKRRSYALVVAYQICDRLGN